MPGAAILFKLISFPWVDEKSSVRPPPAGRNSCFCIIKTRQSKESQLPKQNAGSEVPKGPSVDLSPRSPQAASQRRQRCPGPFLGAPHPRGGCAQEGDRRGHPGGRAELGWGSPGSAAGCCSFKAQQVEMQGWKCSGYLNQAGSATAPGTRDARSRCRGQPERGSEKCPTLQEEPGV